MKSDLIVTLEKHLAGSCMDFIVWVKKLSLEAIYRGG